MTDDKFDELIQMQVQRENKIRQVREDYLNEMEELPRNERAPPPILYLLICKSFFTFVGENFPKVTRSHKFTCEIE